MNNFRRWRHRHQQAATPNYFAWLLCCVMMASIALPSNSANAVGLERQISAGHNSLSSDDYTPQTCDVADASNRNSGNVGVIWFNGNIDWQTRDVRYVESDDGTARLFGTIYNGNDEQEIDFRFSGRTVDPPRGSPNVDTFYEVEDTSDWYYFTQFEGTVGRTRYVRVNASFQVGNGANLREERIFGASAWFAENANASRQDGDINIRLLNCRDTEGSQSNPAPTAVPNRTCDLNKEGFTLINAATDRDIQQIRNGDVINLDRDMLSRLNVRVNTEGSAESIVFELDGREVQTERNAPYALFGDNGRGDFDQGEIRAGSRTLTATAFPNRDGTGQACDVLTVRFEIRVNNDSPDPTATSRPTERPTERPTATPPARVSTCNIQKNSFILINAAANQEIQQIWERDVIHFNEDMLSRLNIRIDAEGSAESVVFKLDGREVQTERGAPYTLFGDNGRGDYNQGTISAGTHELTATAFSNRDATGEVCDTLTVRFEIKLTNDQPTATSRPAQRPTEAPTATSRPTQRPTEAPTATSRPTQRPTNVPTATPQPRPTSTPAAGFAGSSIMIGTNTVSVGDEVVIMLEGFNLEGLGTATIGVDYDPTVLEPVSCNKDPNDFFDLVQCNINYSPESIRFNVTALTGVSGDVPIAEITFRAIGRNGDESEIGLIAPTFANTQGAIVPVNLITGRVIISDARMGDVTCDGSRDAIDSMFTLQHTIGMREGSEACTHPDHNKAIMMDEYCDTNTDANCDAIDAMFTLQCSVGLENDSCIGRNTVQAAQRVLALRQGQSVSTGIQPSMRAIPAGATGRVNVPVTLENVENVGAATFTIVYDQNRLNVATCNTSGDWSVCNPSRGPDMVSVSFITNDNTSGDIEMANIEFDILSALDEPAEFEVYMELLADPDGNSLLNIEEDSSVSVFLPLIQK